MVITLKTISKIRFPVYILPSSNWQLADGLLFLDNSLLDDRNMPGSTLGIRRAQTPQGNLLPLNKQLINLTGIIKQSKPYYIDSNGVPFIYEKTKMCKLSYYKIRKVERKGEASLVWLKGFNYAFEVPRPPLAEMTWAGVLHYEGLPWLLYEYASEKKSETRRKA